MKSKVKLFGFYLSRRMYAQADSLLYAMETENREAYLGLPLDMSQESVNSFITIQRLNLKYLIAVGFYRFTPSEMLTLRAEAAREIPESAFARVLINIITGEIILDQLPEFMDPGILPRESESKMGEIELYPNPSAGEFMIRYPEMKNREAEVLIFNTFGKKMLECVVLFSTNGEYSFATDTFENGAYLIVLKDKYTKIRKHLKLLVNSDK